MIPCSYALFHQPSPVASDPIVVVLNQVSATAVSVGWVQPSEGATVTGYVVHYSDGTTDRMKSVAASSTITSTDISSLSSGRTYTISVEATSSQLSGESEVVTIAVGECILEMCKIFVQYDDFYGVTMLSVHLYSNSTSSSSWCYA